jgi:hypothetical protein
MATGKDLAISTVGGALAEKKGRKKIDKIEVVAT